MQIKTAIAQDCTAIREIHLDAFPAEECVLIADLAVRLLTEPSTPQTLSWVAVIEDTIVGHLALSPVKLTGNNDFLGYLLAPLAVKSNHQNQNIGSTLVKFSLQQMQTLGVPLVFVYGDPNYYGRFGFEAAIASPYPPPYPLQYPFGWQAIALTPTATLPQGKLDCVAPLHNPQLW
jgi:putative acetyltransferase